MLDALEVGDSIETTSGLFGVVIDISGDILIVEFGGDRHCRIPIDVYKRQVQKADGTDGIKASGLPDAPGIGKGLSDVGL